MFANLIKLPRNYLIVTVSLSISPGLDEGNIDVQKICMDSE